MSQFPAWTPPGSWRRQDDAAAAESAPAVPAAEAAPTAPPAKPRGRPPRTVTVAVRKLDLKIGDVLAFSIPEDAPPRDWLRIAEAIRASVPRGVATILMTGGMTIDQLRADGLVPAGPEDVFTVAEDEL